jgi:hypothetical protein
MPLLTQLKSPIVIVSQLSQIQPGSAKQLVRFD